MCMCACTGGQRSALARSFGPSLLGFMLTKQARLARATELCLSLPPNVPSMGIASARHHAWVWGVELRSPCLLSRPLTY